jgi:hypothetical protein
MGSGQRRIGFLPALMLAATVAGPAFANGSVSEFAAGGVTFKPEPQISIAREDLSLSLDSVKVHYDFKSDASGPLTRTIGFPLPKVPQDDSPDSLGGGMENDGDPRNYMHFEVSVNGQPVTPTLHEYAWFNGKNISERLKALGVPVFAPPDEDLSDLPEATIKALEKDGLAHMDGDFLIVRWEYQAVYEWSQNFAPGVTKVDIAYQPLTGAPSDYGDFFEAGEGASTYCVDDAFRMRLKALRDEGKAPDALTLGYILTTANNWQGPIAEFNLKIDPGSDSIASLCPPPGTKAGAPLEWHATNFTPEKDLKVLFFGYSADE